MNKKLILTIIIILISFLIPILIIFKNKETLFEKFNPQFYEKKYSQSQWVIPNSQKLINDIDLYAYSGYKYINGENPILINPEVPPLGKYLIGFSIKIFNNYKIINIIFSFLTLILIFLLTYYLTKSFFLSSLSILFTSINTLFLDQIINSGQLEIFQLFFLLSFFLFFTYFLNKKNNWYLILTGISFGCFISIKFFLYFYLLINMTLILFFLLLKKYKKINSLFLFKTFLSLNFIALLIYFLSYFQFFIKTGGSFLKFFGVQKWIFNFYNQSYIEKTKTLGSYLTLIFFNKWRYWSPNYHWISYENWSLIWPINYLLGLFSFAKLFIKKIILTNFLILLIFIFFIFYNFFLFMTPIYPRYLLLLLIPLNIIIPTLLKNEKF